MINGYSAQQLRAVEAPRIAAGEPLMARAAAGLARQVRAMLPRGDDDRMLPRGDRAPRHGTAGRVLLLVGSGDNGGDALYAGAELAGAGTDVAIVTTGSRVHEGGLAAALATGAHRESNEAHRVAHLAAGVDVIVDGILGTGTSANPALRGTARDVVKAILPVVAATRHPLVIAVDLPSGIDPDDGSVPGAGDDAASEGAVVLPADVTVTFGGYKAGLLIDPARRLAGAVKLVDIGLAPDLARLKPVIRVPG